MKNKYYLISYLKQAYPVCARFSELSSLIHNNVVTSMSPGDWYIEAKKDTGFSYIMLNTVEISKEHFDTIVKLHQQEIAQEKKEDK